MNETRGIENKDIQIKIDARTITEMEGLFY